MNGWDILNVLTRDPRARHVFRGVYSRDMLDSVAVVHTGQPSAYVVNCDKRNEPGSHWVVCWFDGRGTGEYFDSYGLPPRFSQIERFLKRYCKTYRWNRRLIQSPLNNTCGFYCTYYVKKKARGYTLERLLLPFHPHKLYYNDRKILRDPQLHPKHAHIACDV